MMKRLLVLASLVMLLQACYNDKEEELYPNDFKNNNDTGAVTYSGFVQPLVSGKCGGCHPGYTSYAGLKVVVDNGKLNNRVLVKQDMPPAGPLSPADRDKLKKWLDAGAPNN